MFKMFQALASNVHSSRMPLLELGKIMICKADCMRHAALRIQSALHTFYKLKLDIWLIVLYLRTC